MARFNLKTTLAKMTEGHHTSWGQKTSFWSFAIGMIFYYQIIGGYMNSFLLLQGVNMTKIAIVVLLVKLWDAVNDPLFAFIFDKVNFKGKRKEKCLPWLRISALLMPLASIAFFFMPHNWSETGKLIWFAVTYVLWDLAYTVCDVPFFAMTTTMSDNIDERNLLFSWARVFHGAGTLLCGYVMTICIGDILKMDFAWASVIVCGIAVLFTLPLLIIGKEKFAETHSIGEDKSKEEDAPKFTLRQMFDYLSKNKYLTTMYACQILMSAFNFSGILGVVSTKYIWGSIEFTMLTSTLNMIAGPVLGAMLPFFLKKFDRFKMYATCMIICTAWNIVNFSVYFAGWQTIPFAIATAIVTSVPSTLSGLVSYTFTLDALEYGRYKTGIDAKGINFAVQTFSAKIPGAVNNALGMLILGMTTFAIPAEGASLDALPAQTPRALAEMWTVLNLPGIIVSIIAITLLIFFYKLRSKDAAIMAKYNAGEITREACDAQLSRQY